MSPPADILYVTTRLHVGGAERQLVELARRLDRRRFAPTICAFVEGGAFTAEATKAGIPVMVLARRGHFEVRRVRQLAGLLRERNIALVHSFTFEANMYAILANWPRRLCPVICAERTSGNWDRRPYRRLEQWLLPCADLITTNSQAGLNFLCAHYKIRREKLALIHSGIKVESFSPFPAPEFAATFRAAHRLAPVHRLVGMVANLRQTVKNHTLLLRAAARLAETVPEARFLFAGEGEAQKLELVAQARALGVEGLAVFTGLCRDVGQVLALLEVGVLCSDEEGLPNAIMEYMAAGLPVVATAVGGCAELVVDGVTGFLVPRGDARLLAERILWLLQHRDEARRMGVRGRQRVQEYFGMERMVNANVEHYERLLWNRPSPAA